MQKRTIFIPGLLCASLFSISCAIHAQESVSSFEQSLINKNNSVAGTETNYDMDELSEELKKRGWDIQHQTDGSLILLPQQPSINASGSSTEKNTAINAQWQQLQQKFQNAGWSAVLDADGAMHLTPPDTGPATKPELSNSAMSKNEDNSFNNMKQKLKESGWDVTSNSDGSVLLYPPNLYPSQKAVSKNLLLCPGIMSGVEVTLPVDSWQEAHDIAQGWLKNESIENSTVGKIRKILNVYIISIVSNKTPYVLKHQIAIKNANGAVIILN